MIGLATSINLLFEIAFRCFCPLSKDGWLRITLTLSCGYLFAGFIRLVLVLNVFLLIVNSYHYYVNFSGYPSNLHQFLINLFPLLI
jgi:hypothetical protein